MKTNDTPARLRFTPVWIIAVVAASTCLAAEGEPDATTFLLKARTVLSVEQRYDYHRTLKAGPVHRLRRDTSVQAAAEEMSISEQGWRVLIHRKAGAVARFAAEDMREYLQTAMRVDVAVESSPSLQSWAEQKQVIIAGTPEQLSGVGDGLRGYLRDYSISQVGPAEVAAAQIAEAKRRQMTVYCKVDCFATWQFGTTPYLPCPQQWQRRYDALAEYGVNGTLESWSNGYKPNFIAELRAWSCWTDPLDQQTLLESIARREFGAGSEDAVVEAWNHFSRAIQYVPDTGPSMGTNSAVAQPLFFNQPPPRVMTLTNSWWDEDQKSHWRHRVIPYWPYSHPIMVFTPDFKNRTNRAEQYARARSGIGAIESKERLKETDVLPVFNKYVLLAADEFEAGLKLYRQAALNAPKAKRSGALKEVLIVEQMQRMLRSLHAILEFEDLRFRLMKLDNSNESEPLLDRMSEILTAEIGRTEASLETARLDSRLGYECEMDYVYTPYVLNEKLRLLRDTLEHQIPAFRKTNQTP